MKNQFRQKLNTLFSGAKNRQDPKTPYARPGKIGCALFLIAVIGSGLQAQDTWAGRANLGTLACPSTTNQAGNTSGASNSCSARSSNDHFWEFTITSTMDVEINLCTGTTWDTYLYLYNVSAGGCGGGFITSNDDNCSLQSRITQAGLAAGTYVVVIEAYSSGSGAYNLQVNTSNCTTLPDDPCTASPISAACAGNLLTADNTSLTNSGIAAPSCASYAGRDAWFTTVVPATGTVEWDALEIDLTDMGMSVYSVTGGCSGTFTEIQCNDASGYGSMPMIQLLGRTPGETLYVRLWDKNDDENGSFQLQCSDPTTGFCVNGDATDLGSGCADLTDAVNGELGSIWDADDRLDFTTDWSYDFTVNLGNSDAGADGICFVIHNDPSGTSTTGGSGNGMGASGISNSLIIEIDTYINSEDRNDGMPVLDCVTTTDWDHLDIWTGGTVNPGDCSSGARVVANAVELRNGGSLYNIENGLDHTFRISYVGATQTLTATILNSAATVTYGTISHSPVVASTLFGTNYPLFGFTGSTGGLNNNQGACLAASFLPLPIELISFESTCRENAVELKWSTATEINNDYFQIERSSDGYLFEPQAEIPGAGNSTLLINYRWLDEDPLGDVAYYRINQVDYDGEGTLTHTIAADCNFNTNEIGYYQNDDGDLFLVVQSDLNQVIGVSLLDMSGRQIYNAQENINTGYNLIQINQNLTSGAYLIVATGTKTHYSKQLFIR